MRMERPGGSAHQRGQFWKTVPGIITAIAGLVSAVAALIGGLAVAGVLGVPHTGAAPGPASRSTPSYTPAASSTPGSVTPGSGASAGGTPGNGTVPSQKPLPAVVTPQAPLTAMQVNVSADPLQIPPGGTTAISVEVLSAPGSPIKDAAVRIELGGGLFTESQDRYITGTTNPYGFFAAHWQCPPSAPEPSSYYVTATVTKAGYQETAKRITISIA